MDRLFWKVRLYNPSGDYACAWVETSANLQQIDEIQDRYKELTGCKLLLEEMTTIPPTPGATTLLEAFTTLWRVK